MLLHLQQQQRHGPGRLSGRQLRRTKTRHRRCEQQGAETSPLSTGHMVVLAAAAVHMCHLCLIKRSQPTFLGNLGGVAIARQRVAVYCLHTG